MVSFGGHAVTSLANLIKMPQRIDWPAAMRPLVAKYAGKRHPLEYGNTYQLLVMVILSGQATDVIVNQVAPGFFHVYPDMAALAIARPEDLYPLIGKIRNFGNKSAWLVSIAKHLGTDARIPLTMEGLTALPGIGRKSASVILREAGQPPEGLIVDIHVVRVAPRLGIAKEEDPKKIEDTLMKVLPRDEWDAGMAMSFLGREICRPQPECERCLMNGVCEYYAKNKGKVAEPKGVKKATAKAPAAGSAKKAPGAAEKAAPKKKTSAPKKKAAAPKKKAAAPAKKKIAKKAAKKPAKRGRK
jgi:endonuclease-3